MTSGAFAWRFLHQSLPPPPPAPGMMSANCSMTAHSECALFADSLHIWSSFPYPPPGDAAKVASHGNRSAAQTKPTIECKAIKCKAMQFKVSKVALILGSTGIDSKDLTLFAEILKANLCASFCVGREPFRAYCPRRVLARRPKPEGAP